MKMLTAKNKKDLPKLYATDKTPLAEKIIIVKFFCPWSNWTWYVFEGQETENGDYEFFGMVEGHEKELGYFTLGELESIRGPFGLKIERDRGFENVEYSKVS